jgi:hypothetical protein
MLESPPSCVTRARVNRVAVCASTIFLKKQEEEDEDTHQQQQQDEMIDKPTNLLDTPEM